MTPSPLSLPNKMNHPYGPAAWKCELQRGDSNWSLVSLAEVGLGVGKMQPAKGPCSAGALVSIS